MINVLQLLDSVNRGGAETLVLDVCRNARDHGLNVVFAATGGGELEADFAASGVECYRFERRLPVDLRVVRQLRNVIKKHEIQVIHAAQAVEGIHAYLAALGTNAKIVLSFHGYIADAKTRWTLRFLIPRVAANLAVSREFLKWLGKREKLNTTRNFRVLHNGIDENRLRRTNDFRAELKLSPDAFLIGMTGNFYAAPRKDQMTICRALPAVFAAVPDAHCVFAGGIESGAEQKFAECVRFCQENGISDRVHFLGMRRDVPDILHALDVFVLSTLHDSFGIAAAEAMLVGAPCVLSDIEPLREISGDGEFGVLFPPQNAETLAEKLINLANNPNERESLAARAQKFAAENYSIAAHLEELKGIYQSIT